MLLETKIELQHASRRIYPRFLAFCELLAIAAMVSSALMLGALAFFLMSPREVNAVTDSGEVFTLNVKQSR